MVHQLVEYEPRKPLSWFPEKVANARREADKDPLKKQLGYVAKLEGNSFYGKIIEDLDRHKTTKVTLEERVVHKALRSPFFDSLEEIGGVYEIKEFKNCYHQEGLSMWYCCVSTGKFANARILL